MPNVKSVVDLTPRKGAMIHLEDGSKPIWTPEFDAAVKLIGSPIPAGWTLKDGPYGPQALPPKPGGGGGQAAWRNTKEGFEAEAAGRRRWQEIEEDRKDRRTAVMTAFENGPDAPPEIVLEVAGLIYAWLKSSPVGEVEVPGTSGKPPFATDPTGGTSSSPVSDDPMASAPGGDTTPADSGEVSAAPGAGGDSPAIGDPPAPTIAQDYPADWPTERPR